VRAFGLEVRSSKTANCQLPTLSGLPTGELGGSEARL
jgi:hypothetical protein